MKKLISITLIICTVFLLFACTHSVDGGTTPSITPKVIKFETNGGTTVKSHTVSSLISAPETSRENYLFYGWYRDEQLTVPVIYPFTPTSNTTLYAKWIKLKSQTQCKDVSIKNGDGYNYSVSWPATPNGFDLNTLAMLGYKLTITVNFKAKYKKDYDVWLDIGYFGAPQFDAELVDSRGYGAVKSGVTAATSSRSYVLKYNSTAADMLNESIRLSFSTTNMQNIIYFSEITIEYDFYK